MRGPSPRRSGFGRAGGSSPRMTRVAFGTAPALQRTASQGLRAALRPGHDILSSMRSRLHGALHARIDGVERCRTADVESVSLLTAEAQIGDGFRDVDFSKEIAVFRVAADAVLVRI